MNSLPYVLTLALLPGLGSAQALLTDWSEPNGPVHAIVEDPGQGVVFIGGNFDRVGPPLRSGVPLDRATGQPIWSVPRANGPVNDVVPDGQGGCYLAGGFSAVDGQPRDRIARLDASGQLLPFNPASTAALDVGAVTKAVLHNGTLHVVHQVPSSIDVAIPAYTGAVDATTADPLWQAPVVDGAIRDAISDGPGGWYIAGDLIHVNGERREGIARISANGAVHPWNIRVNGPVRKIHRAGDVLYLSGCFRNVMGEDRGGLAALDLGTGVLLPLSVDFLTFAPSSCGPVISHMFRMGDRLYLRGYFVAINYMSGSSGWVDAFTGQSATAPFTTDAPLDDLLVRPDRIWVAGSFSELNGSPRNGLGFMDPLTYELLPAEVDVTGGGVLGLLEGDGVVYLRGSFTAINGQARTGLAALDANTLTLLPWAPELNGSVHAFTYGEGELHVSGSFDMVNGEARPGAAAIDAAGSVLAWAPVAVVPPDEGSPFTRSGDRVLMSLPAQTNALGGTARLLALDATTGEATGWQVQVDGGGVQDICLDGDHLLVAGSFQGLQGQPAQCLGRVALSDATVDEWDAQVAGTNIRRIELAGDKLFVVGEFQAFSAQARSSMAVLSRITAEPLPSTFTFTSNGGTPWGMVADMKAVGDTLYFIGSFISVNGNARQGFAAMRISTDALLPWSVGSLQNDPGLSCLEVSNDTLFIGGDFGYLFGPGQSGWTIHERYHLAALDRHTGIMLDSMATTFGRPTRIRTIGSRLFVLGDVSWRGGEPRRKVAALSMDDGGLTPFQLDVDGEVQALALVDGALFLGGPFSSVNGIAVAGVARVDATTGQLLQFAQPVFWGGEQYAFEGHGGRLFMGTATGLAVHDATSGAVLPCPWAPDGSVKAMDLLDDRLYLGGDFTLVGNNARSGAAAVDLTSDVVQAWAPSGAVRCLSASYSGIALAGSTESGLTVVDPELGSPLPVVRPSSDIQIPRTRVVAAEGEMLMIASDYSDDPEYSVESYLESYHLPSGGRIGLDPGVPQWGVARNEDGLPESSYISSLAIGQDRVYVGGRFTNIGTDRRHNLAVHDRHVQPLVRVDVRASLGGVATSAGLMTDGLRSQGLLPVREPYTDLGFEQHLVGGGEACDASVLAEQDSASVVDWVLVEIRAANDPVDIVATRTGLLRRDGRVVDVDGRSLLSFPVAAGSYHVALRHRNHLGVMSAAPIPLTSAPALLDLRNTMTATYGTDARMPLGNAFALWPGDVTGDGMVRYTGSGNDRDAVLQRIGGSTPAAVVSGVYDVHDVDLDGTIRYTGANNDRDIILQTIGGTVPTATRTQQLP